MERYRFGRVVVKVGSNVLTRDDGTLDTTRMSALSDQIAQLHRGGVEIILVSSGAVAAGRSELGTERKLDSVSARQLFSAVGQVKLINRYYELMRDRGILCGQVLTTKESFSTRRHYLNQQHCMTVMLDHGVIPIVNENDTVSVTELMFTDNDELSGLIAAMMDAEALIILSNIDGIYNGDPSDPASAVIRTVEPHRDDLSGYIQTGRSQFGRGGMLTKYRMASKVADEGIEVTVANGKRDGILTDLLSPGSDVVSTRFVPASHSISQVKKWIAHSEGFAKGELHINEGAYEALLRPEATSLLPVGVCRVEGEFEKDDMRQRAGPAGGGAQRRPTARALRLSLYGLSETKHMEPKSLFERAVEASRWLNRIEPERIDRVLLSVADAAERRSDDILAANREDLARKDPSDPMYDRLQLTPERITGIAADMRNVASLPSPLGLTLDERMRPNGMKIRKVSVPFGVIGVIYEARPNVGFDVFSLCLKAGSACVLKGGSDARDSNAAIAELIRDVLRENGFDEHCVTLMPPGREATTALLEAVGQIDLVIPRGSKGLIDYVRDHARVPVIETGAGVCHTYFDREGDLEKGARIVFNAKTRRVSVCNALDCLIVHRERLADLPELCGPLAERQVVILADPPAYEALDGRYPGALLRHADEHSYGTEFLAYRMSIRTVGSLDEAVEHIARYSSRHSEAVVSENAGTIREFQQRVDAACVYANVSTAFTDGAQFGLGAEIGISTQKLHARGPMALRELTTYKYLIDGDGQTRA